MQLLVLCKTDFHEIGLIVALHDTIRSGPTMSGLEVKGHILVLKNTRPFKVNPNIQKLD